MEAYPEAAAILAQAGWKPHDGWNVYTRDTLVMGFQPDGQAFHVKNWAAIQEGHPQWTADTPDTPEEAAAWLVTRFPANPLATEATLETPVAPEPEAVEDRLYDGNIQHHAGPEGDQELQASDVLVEPKVEADASVYEEPEERDRGVVEATTATDPLDAEYFELPDDPPAEVEDLGSELLDVESELHAPELPAPDPEDFAPDEIEHPETGSGAFIFGDNLDQLRTAAIGLVIRYANSLMPKWSIEDDARLAYLRNFAMGVSERRWDDNPALSAELNALETTIRRINEIKNARDAKVEFLEGASREEIVDFAVEADWP